MLLTAESQRPIVTQLRHKGHMAEPTATAAPMVMIVLKLVNTLLCLAGGKYCTFRLKFDCLDLNTCIWQVVWWLGSTYTLRL